MLHGEWCLFLVEYLAVVHLVVGLIWALYHHHSDNDYSKLPLKYNWGHSRRVFSFQYSSLDNSEWKVISLWIEATMRLLHWFHSFLQLYVHSPEDYPNFNSELVYHVEAFSFREKLLFHTTETVNSNNIREESFTKRACRFPDERLPSVSDPYSFASCLNHRRVQMEIQHCNCTLHTSPVECKPPGSVEDCCLRCFLADESNYCSYLETFCILRSEITEKTLEYHHKVEPCLPSCTEMDIEFIGWVVVKGWTEVILKGIHLFAGSSSKHSTSLPTDLMCIQNYNQFWWLKCWTIRLCDTSGMCHSPDWISS